VKRGSTRAGDDDALARGPSSRPSAAPLGATLRAVWSTSGRAAARVAGPTFSALAVLGAIVFGPNGMRARDLVLAMRASPSLGVAVGALWLALSVPAAEVTLGARGLRALRSQPLSLAWLVAAQGGLLLGLSLPLALLMARGHEGPWGVVAGLGALTSSSALAALGVVTREARPLARAAGLALGGAALTLVPPSLLALVGPPALAWVLPRAHLAGLARPRGMRSRALPRTPVLALAATLGLGLARGARARLHTALGLAALGVGASALALSRERGASFDEAWPWALGVALVPAGAGLAVLAPSLARGALALDPVVRASGAPLGLARLAALLMGAALGLLALAPVGASLVRAMTERGPLEVARALLGPLVVGAALGVALVSHALGDARREKPEPARLVVATCATLGVGLAALPFGDGPTLGVSLGAALALAAPLVRA
jgi:hypothetical protein